MTVGEKSGNAAKKEDGKDNNIALLEAHANTAHTDSTKASFLTSVDEEARIKLALDQGVFIGFTKEELLKFEQDPGWKRLRLVLLILFWLAWALLLIAAVVVIVLTPACPTRPVLQWPENFPIYEINVPSFRIGSRCDDPPAIAGNVDGVLDILTAPSNNYFDRLQPADILWLRDIYLPQNGDDSPTLKKNISANIDKLFEVAKKKQRRILLDLLPFVEESKIAPTLKKLECGIFYGSNVRESADTSPWACVTQEAEVKKMVEYVNKYRGVASGFVLDYSKWLLGEGKSYLEQLVDAVTQRSSGESASGDNAKHLFMRFPILDKRFVYGDDKKQFIEKRIEEEEIARKAGVRMVIETIAMNEDDPAACSTVECLAELVNIVQGFGNGTTAYRAFAIDDPTFKGRTGASSQWQSVEALSAFFVTALPGTPVIYYGSEIGMTSKTSATEVMQWTDLNNNTCIGQSYMCFCNLVCQGNSGSVNRSCPSETSLEHEASVREQIRAESSGPFKSLVALLGARQSNDSLNWGMSNVIVDQTTPARSQKVLVAVRQAGQFERFGLFVSVGSQSKDKEVVPHIPDDMANSCYQTVYSFSNGEMSSGTEKQRFSQMVLKKDEVRLVRVYKTCSATATRALSWSMVLVLLAMLYTNIWI